MNCIVVLFFPQQTVDHYTLIVKGTDMGGAEDGKTGTGTVRINVTDINDNIPTLEKSEVRKTSYTVDTSQQKAKNNNSKEHRRK